jgi:hypothetical protein
LKIIIVTSNADGLLCVEVTINYPKEAQRKIQLTLQRVDSGLLLLDIKTPSLLRPIFFQTSFRIHT